VIFLVAGFTFLITRPIRQIDDAIRRLGQADFSTPIKVGGPDDLQHLGARLDWMRRRLADLEEQKTRFLREMSHELKTPLTALRQGAELLADELVGKLTPEQREIAEILRRNSIELQKLIEDLLNYGASQFHRTALEIGPVEIRRVAARVIDDHKLALRSRDLKLELDLPDIRFSADSEKLRVMLDNLLSNAIKFSPAGGTVRMAARVDRDDVEIEVADQGPGIAVEERTRVFEPFYRGRSAAGALVKGTGIGLSVVREYVQMHGGSVEFVGEGPGARIQLRLPRDATARTAAREAEAADAVEVQP
jgi:two-component system sensor histidine kinase GlrK